jgi:hypothetical protein
MSNKQASWHVLTALAGKPSRSRILHLPGCSHTYWRGQPGVLRPATAAEQTWPKCRDCLRRLP